MRYVNYYIILFLSVTIVEKKKKLKIVVIDEG